MTSHISRVPVQKGFEPFESQIGFNTILSGIHLEHNFVEIQCNMV